ncbi:type VI secretion system-associated FHA domain protein TagH [Sphingomonas segetis]|uniref:type VI secretion system-associated FHA domain protein TagH n=1 Tax=Sphingomonas segetis TaxID=1104779 RepID=UPI0012D3481C|nr:type VI secretion system-associated FHA domain protein TagH [Sphingomonas segetis]
MTLTLVIRNAAALENGMPTEFVLHERGAVIGRADTCDWSLPDPQRHISSRHCEVRFHDGSYWLTDTSTNGTFVNNSADPLQGEHRIEQGDVILVGDFEIGAELSGSAAAEPEGELGAQEAFAEVVESDIEVARKPHRRQEHRRGLLRGNVEEHGE